jgi:hypothetical protein
MKQIFLSLLILASLSYSSRAQIMDSISMGPGANQMVFYSLSAGTVATASNEDWQIAFSMRGAVYPYNTNQATAIRINEAFGFKVFRSPTQKIASFSSFDTTGYHSWQQLHNPDTTWKIGAFNINKNFANDFNYGWGGYNSTTHAISSDSSLYLLVMPNGDIKKFALLDLSYDTAYNMIVGNLNATVPDAIQVHKTSATKRTRCFVYLDLDAKVVRDKEPNITSWDMVFLRYTNTAYDPINPTQDMGVLTNDRLMAYAAPVSEINNGCSFARSYSPFINVIGKSFVTHPSENLIPDLSYWLTDGTRNYKLRFTDFGSAYSGRISFTKSNCSASTSIAEQSIHSTFHAYPIPASNQLTISLSIESEASATLEVLDMTGRVLISKTSILNAGQNSQTLDVSALSEGNFLLQITQGGIVYNRRIAIVR